MGFFGAVGSCYGNMLNFSGRARRAEYWWFFLFQILFGWTIPVAVYFLMPFDLPASADLLNEQKLEAWMTSAFVDGTLTQFSGYVFAAQLILIWLPNLAVTVRRLHDTERSGWWMFKPFIVAFVGSLLVGFLGAMSGGSGGMAAIMLASFVIPLGVTIWWIVVLAMPGTHGNNRFGPDPIKGRKRRAPDHPAFAAAVEPEERATLESARRAEIKDYYRKNVLPNVQKA